MFIANKLIDKLSSFVFCLHIIFELLCYLRVCQGYFHKFFTECLLWANFIP